MVNDEIRRLVEKLAGECKENNVRLDEVFELLRFYDSNYKTPPRNDIEAFKQKATQFLMEEGLTVGSVRFSRTLTTLVIGYEKENTSYLMKELAFELSRRDNISRSTAQSFLSGNMCFFRDWVYSQKCYDTRFLTSPSYIQIMVSHIKNL